MLMRENNNFAQYMFNPFELVKLRAERDLLVTPPKKKTRKRSKVVKVYKANSDDSSFFDKIKSRLRDLTTPNSPA